MLKFLHLKLFALLLLAAVLQVNAQRFVFRQYTTDNGLSHNNVNCSLQDSKGFMWFGTPNGLNRFDGRIFKIFRKDSIGGSIGSSFISALCEDKQKNLWVGTHNGLWRFDAETERFHPIDFTYTQWITNIICDDNGDLWLVCNQKLYKYNYKTNTHKVYTLVSPTTTITTPNKDIYVGTLQGHLYKLDAKNDSFDHITLVDTNSLPGARVITNMLYTGYNSILIGTRAGNLKLFDIKTNKLTNIKKSFNNEGAIIKTLIKYDRFNYWIGTTNGINIYNIASGKLTNLPDNEINIAYNDVNTFCRGSDGGIWVGTTLGGENYYNKQNNLFKNYEIANNPNRFLGTVVTEVVPDAANNIWVATKSDGLFVADKGTNTLKPYNTNYKNISGLLVNDDELWLGEIEKGFNVIDIKSRKIKRTYKYLSWPSGHKTQLIYTFYKTKNGTIWAGTSQGLFIYNAAYKTFSPVESVPDGLISVLEEDAEGNLWVGTFFSGLYYLDTHTMLAKMMNIDFSKGSQYDNTITGICRDGYNNMWFSSESAGIAKYDFKTGKIGFIDLPAGLASVNLFKILADKKNNIWVSSSAGLFSYNQHQKTFTRFTKDNGLPSNQFYINSGYRSPGGDLFFGSINGLVSFNPDSLDVSNKVFPLYITGMQVENEELIIGKNIAGLNTSVLTTKQVNLPYNHSSISIDFASLTYAAPESISYAYKMEGQDREWTSLKTNRRVFFTNLPPGEYTFRVKAANSLGKWTTEKSMVIFVAPPWWLSRWAYVTYALLLVAAVLLMIAYYKRKAQREKAAALKTLENEKDKELYKAKIDFFTNVTHEIRTPLTLMVAPLEKIEDSDDMAEIRENAKLVHRNTHRLISLTNQLLDFRKAEIEGFKLNFIKTDIVAVLREVYTSFRASAENKNLTYTLSISREHVFSFVDTEAFRKMVSNLVHNAIKYSDKEIQVKFVNHNDAFEIIVSNDGPLIPEHLKEKIFEPFYRAKSVSHIVGTGIGLALARSLAELHKGALTVDTGKALNTFTLTLPVHQEIEFDFADTTPEALTVETEPDDQKSAILLIEDNREISDFLFKELSGDYTILRAPNGEIALTVLNEHMVELVISDIMMPVMDGYEVCRRIKSNVDFSHIPVLLLSAKNSIDAKIAGLNCGADVYVEKPFTLKYLTAQITSLLENREKLKNRYAVSPVAGLDDIAYSTTDKLFLEKLNGIVLAHMANPEFEIDQLADMLHMSRRNMFRKIKGITGMAPLELINVIRLKKAAELLLHADARVYEVADMVGFNSRGVFTRKFTKQFGMSPTEYVKQNPAAKSAYISGD